VSRRELGVILRRMRKGMSLHVPSHVFEEWFARGRSADQKALDVAADYADPHGCKVIFNTTRREAVFTKSQ
jgi:hypothetical protein